jgi:hypothetical protein
MPKPRRSLALAALCTLPALAAPAQETPPPPCAGAEHRAFDFWIGEWDVTDPDGAPAGRNRIESILDGCVLLETWEGAQGSAGRSFNMFDARGDGRWHQTWVDGSGGRLDLVGGLDGEGRMVLEGERPGAEGGTVRHRITWTPEAGGTVRQHWQASSDAGATWNDLFLGTYRRRDGSS